MKNIKSKVGLSALLTVLMLCSLSALSWAGMINGPTGGWRGELREGKAASQYQAGLARYRMGDYQGAYRLWHPLAVKGNAAAQYRIGAMYLNGLGVPKDPVEARRWFMLSATRGNAEAQNDLGSLYLNGQGVRRNVEEALKWYQQSANQGNATGQHNLGLMYFRGWGVRKSFAKARVWFRVAAMQGHARAKYYLGRLPLQGS